MRILIAEDELVMQKILKLYLEKEGYKVHCVADGQQALESAYETPYDLIILDWMMPKVDGIEVCQELRRLNHRTKILMITAKSEVEDEIKGLSEGVDDYIRKPFDPKVFVLRVGKLLGKGKCLTCGGITLDPQKVAVEVNGQPVQLSKIEYALLHYMISNQGVVLTRDQLLAQVWGVTYEGDERTIDTHIRRLRKKIGESTIQTLRGIGYCMRGSHE